MVNSARNQPLLLLAAFGAVLVAAGFILQYGFGVIPCHMCWWQRYAHFAIVAASLFGMAAPQHTRASLAVVCAAALGGLGVALWQFAAQHQWLPYPASCSSDAAQALAGAADLIAAMNNQPPIVPCDKEDFVLLGLSLAGWNIPAMLAVIGFSLTNLRK